MPRRTKVSELPDCEKDEPLMLMTGKLIKLYERRESKPGDRKQWSIQNGVIRDETGEIKIMFTGRDHAIPGSWKGQDIVLESYHGDRGYSGLYAYDDDYDGTVTRIVKTTKTAIIHLANEGGEDSREEPRSDSRSQGSQGSNRPAQSQQRSESRRDEPADRERDGGRQQQQQQPPPQEPPAEVAPEVLDRNISRAIYRDALLYARCVSAFKATILPALQGVTGGVSEETVHRVSTSLFIQASRRGDSDRIVIPPKKPAPASEPPPQEPEAQGPPPGVQPQSQPQGAKPKAAAEPPLPKSGPGSRGGTSKSRMSAEPPKHNGPGATDDEEDDIPF